MSERRPLSERLIRRAARPPFGGDRTGKGWLASFARAQPHVVVRQRIEAPGWPKFSRPLRIAFLTDLHAGSHTADAERLAAIAAEAAAMAPDLVLLGGDYVNMQPFGGGRLPPDIVARAMARIEAPLGAFAVLGNHDYTYGEREVAASFEAAGIAVLDHVRATVTFDGAALDIVGVPDAHVVRDRAHALLAGLSPQRPAIVLAHDPVWFGHVPAGPFVTLAGHTHGGQIRLPGLGVIMNSSKAPLRWSQGLIVENGRTMFVSAGLGTSSVPLRIGVPPEYALLDIGGG